MDHILFKISYPAECHAQTAIECAIQWHKHLNGCFDQVQTIEIQTHESALRIINKEGPLHNPADRDHCLQYMVAIALIYGDLNPMHYEDTIATNPLIDILRSRMHVTEYPAFSQDYLDPSKRSIANRIRLYYTNGTYSPWISIEYPLGHFKRRAEGVPLLIQKFKQHALSRFDHNKTQKLLDIMTDLPTLCAMKVEDFMALWSIV